MAERVTMPALGESVTEGTVTRWLKNVGDSVEVDEPLLEVSTDKVDTEIPSPVAGTLQEILAEEDETVPVGADLAVIGDGEAPSGDSGGSQGQAAEEASPGDDESAAEQTPAQAEADAEAGNDAGDEGGQDPAEPASGSSEQPEPAGGGESAPAEEPQAPSGGGGEGTTVTMPALGESVTEGTVTRWLKSEGDEVTVDEPLLEVSTDKVDTEIPSPVAGTLTRILVQEDETVPVGGDLAVVGGSGGGSGAASGGEAAAEPKAEEPSAEQDVPAQSPEPDQVPAAEPAAEAPEAEDLRSDEPSDEAPAEEPAREEQAAAPPAPGGEDAPATSTAPAPRQPSGESGDASAYVTPLVRKLAADHGIDLASVTGTGVGGRIRKQDVLAAAEKAEKAARAEAAPAADAPAPGPAAAPVAAAASARARASDAELRGTTQPMTRLRKVIAKRMVESLQVSAQLTAVVEVDMTKVVALRTRRKEEFERREGVRLTYLPFISLAVVEALKAHPRLNASVEGEEITFHGAEHLGIAVDTERGLLVPVIRDAGDLSVSGIAKKIADLASRTRDNKVTPDELGGGTFTITNIGSAGSLLDTPIINQPQVAILGTGAMVKRPVVVTDATGADSIAVRSMMFLVLTYDHRVVDGADAGRFLSSVKARLEEGSFEGSL